MYTKAYTNRGNDHGKCQCNPGTKDFFELIKDAITKHKVFRIHHRDGDVVLMSDEEYESLQETLELLSIKGFRESIKKSFKQIEKGRNIFC